MQIKQIKWDFDAWKDYCKWQQESKVIIKRINMLIKDIQRSPFEGIGNPEPLKENLSGFWILDSGVGILMMNIELSMQLKKRR